MPDPKRPKKPPKAFGHEGIELHQAQGIDPLCRSCTYDRDNSCDYPQRPTARECTMYRDVNQKPTPIVRYGARKPSSQSSILVGAIVLVLLVLLVLTIGR
jgi:hypothetical protein